MIPKIIHFVWFGGKPYPKKIKYCIDSWKRILPDYRFIRWDESNFDVNSVSFTKEAFEVGQWAFISDYVRIKALYEIGGWYLDTDVEVLKPLAPFEDKCVVLGTDETGSLTAVYGTEPKNEIWKNILGVYNNTHYLKPNGSQNQKVINQYIQEEIAKMGYVHENKMQELKNGIVVYPDDYFHVVSLEQGTRHFTENSTCIHWQTMLWTPKKSRMLRWIRLRILKPIMGDNFMKVYSFIVSIIKNKATNSSV